MCCHFVIYIYLYVYIYVRVNEALIFHKNNPPGLVLVSWARFVRLDRPESKEGQGGSSPLESNPWIIMKMSLSADLDECYFNVDAYAYKTYPSIRSNKWLGFVPMSWARYVKPDRPEKQGLQRVTATSVDHHVHIHTHTHPYVYTTHILFKGFERMECNLLRKGSRRIDLLENPLGK